jgi:hypothetical protein
MTFRSNDPSVKWPFSEKSFRSNELSVKWFFGQTTLCAFFFRSNDFQKNELSVKWPFGQKFSVRWFFGKVIQNPKKDWNLSLVKQFPPSYNSDSFFGNYFRVQEHENELTILKFDVLTKGASHTNSDLETLKLELFCRTNLKHSLLPICGKFTRALLAHQIF